jgi:hypothetical protein
MHRIEKGFDFYYNDYDNFILEGLEWLVTILLNALVHILHVLAMANAVHV